MGRPIAAGMGKLVQKLAVRAFRQPLPRQGWAQKVAAEVFERLSGVGVGDMPRAGGYVQDPAVVEAATSSANGMVVSTLTSTESPAAADSRL